jgi:hypothetical protein
LLICFLLRVARDNPPSSSTTTGTKVGTLTGSLTIREGLANVPLAFGSARPTFLALGALDLSGEGVLQLASVPSPFIPASF